MNEKNFIREVLVSKQKPSDISISYLATLIAKYYFYNCSSEIELTDMVQDKLSEFNIPGYQEYLYHDKIKKLCEELFDSGEVQFKELEYIPIYENELAVINSLDSDQQKKLMFTIYAVARYMDCDGWVNKKTTRGISEIFKLANIHITVNEKNEMLHELYDKGYITFAKRIDNLNIQVELDDSGEIAYKIKEFSNLGYQYIGHFKKGYRQCQLCGKAIRTTNNRRKYCKKCAKKVQAEQVKQWHQNAKVPMQQNKEKL